MVGGDFNMFRFAEERFGSSRNTRAMRDFTNIINELTLVNRPVSHYMGEVSHGLEARIMVQPPNWTDLWCLTFGMELSVF